MTVQSISAAGGADTRLEKLARLHLWALAGATAIILLAAYRIPRLPLGALLLTVSVVALANLALIIYLRRRGALPLPEGTTTRLTHAQIALDIIALTLMIGLSGGSENPFFPFYVFPVILAAALLSRRAAFLYALTSALLYGLLLVGEAAGWLPHPALIGPPLPDLAGNRPLLAAQWLALFATVMLAAAATALLVEALHARATELSESRARAEVRASHMRDLNEQLRAANAECRHQREHLDAAYVELQRAYDRLSVRSSQLSELNEQLRAANAECKGRREELEVLNTKLGLANQKLRELEDIRAQFTLLVTHELRAPVAAIQSYLKLILEGYVPEDKTRETLEKAERRAVEQLALISDLLELGRIGSADARGQVQPVQLEKALSEQIELLSAGAAEQDVTIQLAVDSALPPVLANPDQIKSLWNNLISNAIKYNRKGGRIEIALRQTGDRLEARVSDTGIGIPPEAMPHLFSEFFRADNAKAHSRGGTGLGLSIVKEIVERAGGRITAESELGIGTTLRFWLPIIGHHEQLSRSDRDLEPATDATGTRPPTD